MRSTDKRTLRGTDMRSARRRPARRLKCSVRTDLGLELLNWVRRIVRSNDELAAVLTRLRDSYNLLLAGISVTDADEILRGVDGALLDAEQSTVLMSNSLRTRRIGEEL